MEEPLLNVVRGDPTPAELAAVVSAVAVKLATDRTGAGVGAEGQRTKPSGWAAYWRTVQRPIQPGPGAWKRSALPK